VLILVFFKYNHYFYKILIQKKHETTINANTALAIVFVAFPVILSGGLVAIPAAIQTASAQPGTVQEEFNELIQRNALFEQRLAQSNPHQQQVMIANYQQGLMQFILHLAQVRPHEVPGFINLQFQAMSPQLQQIVLLPVLNQLSGASGSGTSSGQHLGDNTAGNSANPSTGSGDSFIEDPADEVTQDIIDEGLGGYAGGIESDGEYHSWDGSQGNIYCDSSSDP